MPSSLYVRVRIKKGPRKGSFNHYRLVKGKKKLIGKKAYDRAKKTSFKKTGTFAQITKNGGNKKMAKRGNGSSYSKQNIAIGTLMSQVVPKFAPGVAQFLPLTALIPKAPVALKVMGWGLASKIVSDRFINR